MNAHLTSSLALVLALGLLDRGGFLLGPSDPPGARMVADSRKGEMVIELAPVDLPPHASHHEVTQPPVALLEVPAGGWIYGFRLEVLDEDGRPLPASIVHHFNLIDPDHRELFLPVSRRLLAAGKETGAQRMPWLLFGVPLERGARLLASAMIENPTPTAHRGVRVRVVMPYVPERRPWPFFRVFPWQLDAAFPVGDKSFDLPPGRSSKSYEASPAVAGTVVGIGGHVHNLAEAIEFADATTGEVIYRAAPVTDSAGRVVAVPVGRLYRWNRLGVRIVPEHRYRVTVYYNNPTGAVIPDGGMGVVGGVFRPDRDATWPATNPADSLYQRDLRHAMRLDGGEHGMKAHAAHGHH